MSKITTIQIIEIFAKTYSSNKSYMATMRFGGIQEQQRFTDKSYRTISIAGCLSLKTDRQPSILPLTYLNQFLEKSRFKSKSFRRQHSRALHFGPILLLTYLNQFLKTSRFKSKSFKRRHSRALHFGPPIQNNTQLSSLLSHHPYCQHVLSVLYWAPLLGLPQHQELSYSQSGKSG